MVRKLLLRLFATPPYLSPDTANGMGRRKRRRALRWQARGARKAADRRFWMCANLALLGLALGLMGAGCLWHGGPHAELVCGVLAWAWTMAALMVAKGW